MDDTCDESFNIYHVGTMSCGWLVFQKTAQRFVLKQKTTKTHCK